RAVLVSACSANRLAIVPSASDSVLMTLARAIVAGDDKLAMSLLAASPRLASACFEGGATRQAAKAYYLAQIERYVYAGDTALHIAAASYRSDIAQKLLE